MANDVNKDLAQDQNSNQNVLEDTILVAQADEVEPNLEADDADNNEAPQENAEESAEEGGNAPSQSEVVRIAAPLGEDNVARLPADADLTQPRIVDGELEFLQPDGTIFFVPDGAVQGMSIFVGDVEFPSEALQALFDANSIQPAAGPSVTGEADTPQPVQDSHGAYQDSSQGSIGDGLGISPLLPPTALAFATPEQEEIYEGPEVNVDPIGLDDTNWVQEDGGSTATAGTASRIQLQSPEATGNVLENIDHPGAPSGQFGDQADTDENPTDTLTVTNPGTYIGEYGTLVLNDDGSYTYTLNNNDPNVQGLSDGETITERFPYTISDGNGGSGSATLTITVFGSDDGVYITGLSVEGPDETVYEANLSNGSAPDNSALTQAGDFQFSSVDGAETITIEGVVIFENGAFVGGTPTITTSIGSLTITSFAPVTNGNGEVIGGTISYSYTLDDNTETHNFSGNDTITELFDVEVIDQDGSADTATLNVCVVDDVPTAVADTGGPVTEGGTLNVAAGAGVLSNDTEGADGATIAGVRASGGDTTSDVSGGVGVEIDGEYGKLTLNADGSYTYVSDADDISSDAQDVF
ncbi:VCBS domain-containing protein, partial [Maritalea myrionectae]|uniref:VCBS domain-containing protein n=1 Tax=Maritalea myrionectae TaxID=454601 RepID=UPI00055CE34C